MRKRNADINTTTIASRKDQAFVISD